MIGNSPSVDASLRKVISNVTLFLLSLFLCSLLADRSLALFGYPAELPPRIAHPPNYSESRKSIEYTYEFKTNSRGLRYREIPVEKKAENEMRFILVGDSFVEGTGVNLDQTFGTLLEKRFSNGSRKALFINCGLSGTGPLQYGNIFYNVGLKYHPDVLLIAIYANDVANTPYGIRLPMKGGWINLGQREKRTRLKRFLHFLWPRIHTSFEAAEVRREYRLSKQPGDIVKVVKKRAKQIGIPAEKILKWEKVLPQELVEAANKGEFSPSIFSYGLFYPDFWFEALDIPTPRSEAKWLSMVNVLSEIINFSRKIEIKVGIMFFPSFFQAEYNKQFWDLYEKIGFTVRHNWYQEETEVEKRLTKWADAHHVPFLNLAPSIRKAAKREPGVLYYTLDGHWTPKGHRVVASAISPWLVKNGLLAGAGLDKL